ncbi:MAG TPA: prephenate dehydrogenase/arogenate dehydrogenase family protein, partial [Gemmatimonadaceae bacterium]|nr:prephenate dehydrogenase/arogenate dehydrogenase family protein [Gemmatimonadaceae bacterium]
MMEDDFRSVAIVGLGLIGGSLARDLAERGVHVRAYDADPYHLRSALRDGFVAEAMDATLGGVCDAEIVIVAVPVDAATEVLRQIAPYAGNAKLITDVGSTKSRIVALAGELGLGGRFVGSHPMAGDHRSGWD